MKYKKPSLIFIGKSILAGLLFFVFFSVSIEARASSDLSTLPPPNVLNSLKTNNTTQLLNTLKNASFISRLSVPKADSSPSPIKTFSRFKNINLTFPNLKIKPVDLSLMGASVMAVGDYFVSDYQNYILYPVVNVENNILAFIGNDLLSGGKMLSSITLPKINLAEVPAPQTDVLANALSADVSFVISNYNSFAQSTMLVLNNIYSFALNTDTNFQKLSLNLVLPKITLPRIAINLPKISISLPHIVFPTKSILNKFAIFYDNYTSELGYILVPAPSKLLAVKKEVPTTTSVAIIPAVQNDATKEVAQVVNANAIKDCGVSVAPKLDTPATYEKNSTLSCLAQAALNCQNAKGTLTDNFFPTNFEISNAQTYCTFKLSYPSNSVLTDTTGKKLANQSVTCPVNVVRGMDDTNPDSVRFMDADKTDLGKYGSEIYFYGTLGLFIQNNLDQNKIHSLGCSGEYINTVIASYNNSNK